MNSTPKSAPLWTRDFTILTLGSVVSMLGNALAGFAIDLLVLDYTNSTVLYAIYLSLFMLPQIVMPIFSGAILDRFSRRKTIYTLDFLSAALYAVGALILRGGWFSFPVLAIFCFFIGCINSIYFVAYESFYPLLISEGNYSKAYAISSVLETFSAVMVPLSAFLYKLVGIAPLLAINAGCFLLAAIMETQIKAKEDYIELQKQRAEENPSGAQLLRDIKEGLQYLRQEKGLLCVALYFTASSFAYGAETVLALPYFREHYDGYQVFSTALDGEYVYMMVYGMAVVGRAIGGLIHYKLKLPVKKKFAIALAVYLIVSVCDGGYLFTPVPMMMALCFIAGILSITSYTIRASATQSYVPDEKKGRFNGAFNMLNTVGGLGGEWLAGALAVVVPARGVVAVFMAINALAALVFIGGGRKQVAPIYNRQE